MGRVYGPGRTRRVRRGREREAGEGKPEHYWFDSRLRDRTTCSYPDHPGRDHITLTLQQGAIETLQDRTTRSAKICSVAYSAWMTAVDGWRQDMGAAARMAGFSTRPA